MIPLQDLIEQFPPCKGEIGGGGGARFVNHGMMMMMMMMMIMMPYRQALLTCIHYWLYMRWDQATKKSASHH